MPFWNRTPDPAIHHEVWEFLAEVKKLDPKQWAQVIGAAGDVWGDGIVRVSAIFEGMSEDPVIEPFVTLYATPDRALRQVIDSAGRARQDCAGLDMFMVTYTFIETGKLTLDIDLSVRAQHLVDTLTKMAAIAIARRDVLPRPLVVSGVMCFLKPMPVIREWVNLPLGETLDLETGGDAGPRR